MWPMYQSDDGRLLDYYCASEGVQMHNSNSAKLFDWVTVFIPVYMHGHVDLLSKFCCLGF